jgi:hypothetical protein
MCETTCVQASLDLFPWHPNSCRAETRLHQEPVLFEVNSLMPLATTSSSQHKNRPFTAASQAHRCLFAHAAHQIVKSDGVPGHAKRGARGVAAAHERNGVTASLGAIVVAGKSVAVMLTTYSQTGVFFLVRIVPVLLLL